MSTTFYYLSGISLLPITLGRLDFTSFVILRNQESNQESNQAINQGDFADG